MDLHKLQDLGLVSDYSLLDAHQVFCIACALIGIKKTLTKNDLAAFCFLDIDAIDKMCDDYILLKIILNNPNALEPLLLSQSFAQVFPKNSIQVDEKTLVKVDGDKEYSTTDTKIGISDHSCSIPLLAQLLTKVSQNFAMDVGLSGKNNAEVKFSPNISEKHLIELINLAKQNTGTHE